MSAAHIEIPLDATQRVRTVLLAARYSHELTELMDGVAGPGTSGNNEVQVLTHLFDVGRCGRRELIELTAMSRSGVAQLIDRLAALGLIVNTIDDDDRRVILTALTAAGRRRVRSMLQAFAEFFASPNPLVDELLDILGLQEVVERYSSRDPLDALARIASVGAALSRRLDEEVGLGGPRQRLALATLAESEESRPSVLAAELGLTSGGITHLVDQLESDGIVERLYGVVPDDRRAVVIKLTAAGRDAAHRSADILFEHADELARALAAAHPASAFS